MKTHIQRWGNSLAVRIPKVVAQELGIGEDTAVELDMVDDALVIRVAASEFSLEQLLASITDDNLHAEVDTGPAIGAEAW
jgi:antitoxin MazE